MANDQSVPSYGAQSSLNSAGIPLKQGVEYNGQPNVQNSPIQPDINLMCGPEGPHGVVNMQTASKLYNVSKLKVI